MAKIGTAYIEVDADLDQFHRKIDREVATLGARFKGVGRSAGQDFATNFQQSAGAGIILPASVSRDLDRQLKTISSSARDTGNHIADAGRKASSYLGGDVVNSARKASSYLAETETHGNRLTNTFKRMAASFGGGGDGISNLRRHLNGFGDAAGGATATLGGLRIALAALIPIAIALAGTTTAVVSALAPLVGLAASAGGLLAAAGQGFGVFKLAVSGVADALKEQTTKHLAAAGAAISNAAQQRAAARQIQSAEEGVRNANQQLARAQEAATAAQKNLSAARTDARRALVDMHQALDDAILNEERAVRGLEDAHAALERTLAGATPEDLIKAEQAVTSSVHDREQAILNLETAQAALVAIQADATASDAQRRQAILDVSRAQDALASSQINGAEAEAALAKLKAGPSEHERRDALLDVRAAQESLTEATRDRTRQEKDLAAADRAGVEGSQQVVAARKAIRDANAQLVEAERNVARALQAVSDAQLSAKDSAAGAAVGAGKLNTAMDSLSPPAQAFVRQLIALKPKLDELKATAAGGFFPGASGGLTAAMGSFGAFKTVVGQTAGVLGDFARKTGELVGGQAFGKDIETIGGRNAKALDTMGEATRHVISALRHVLVAAGPLTQWLADVANKWALNAAEAAKAGRESGKLGEFFERTRAVAERLGSILGHLAHGLFGVGKAGSQTGNEILASIDRAAKRFDEWANSVQGQRGLHDFFQRTKELAAAIVPALAGMAQAFGLVTLKLLPLTTVLTLLGPLADEATVAFVGYKVAVLAASAASNIATVASKAWAAGQWLLNAALTANPIGLVITAIAALAAAFVVAYTKSETFRNVIDRVWSAIKTATTTVWNAISGYMSTILGVITTIITTHFEVYKTIVTTAWGVVKTVTSTAWSVVRNLIVDPMRDAASAVRHALGDDGLAGWLSDKWRSIIKAIGGFAGDAKDTITDAFRGAANLVIGFVNLILKAINLIPGVPNIKLIDKIGENTPGNSHIPADKLARGGKITRPMAIVGEEAPQHPEFVIPTNPAYRKRALGLHAQLSKDLGIPGFAKGGILGDIGDLAEKGFDFIKGGLSGLLGKLPGVGSLPDWLKGMGSHVLAKVGQWIKDKVGGLLGGGGGGDLGDSLGAAGKIVRMIATMNQINAKGYPYVYGGGHASFDGPYDCSGLVSAILHSAGLLGHPITTDGLKVYGQEGDGKYVTIGVRGSTGRSAHTMMQIGRRFLESGSGHGARWVDGWSGHFPIHRHPPGLAKGGTIDTDVVRQLLGDRGLGWGLKHGGTLPFVGSYATGGVIPRDGLAKVHRGETVLPDGLDLYAEIHIGGERIDEIVETRLEVRDRELAGVYSGGVRPR